MFLLVCLAIFGCAVAGVYFEGYNPYTEALSQRPWDSVQNYVEVRPGAFIFYWLYYADGTRTGADRKPLIIWIQGGPGLAASGIANFAEIGPLNMEMKPRNHTWVRGRNVLLIDHPVGTGFSYVENKSLLVRKDRMMAYTKVPFASRTIIGPKATQHNACQDVTSSSELKCSHGHRFCDIATDLSRTIKAFFRMHKEFRKTPTYLLSQSYGGKLCPRLAFYLHTAIEKKRLKMNFKGIGIGSGWVDPKESTLVHPDFLYNMGALDQNTYLKCLAIVKKIADYIDRKDYVAATKWDDVLYKITTQESGMDINYNNINQVDVYKALNVLEKKVNKYVKPTLKIVNQSLEWSYISEEVFQSLNQSFFVPSTKFLEMLLNRTQLKIAVYNGNLDVVTPLAGASNWVHKLKWHGADEFKSAKRVQINGYRNGFYKKSSRLTFWWVFGAGHWVPEDNPAAMEQILEHLMSSDL